MRGGGQRRRVAVGRYLTHGRRLSRIARGGASRCPGGVRRRAVAGVVLAYVAARHGDLSLILDAVDDSVKAFRALGDAIISVDETHKIDRQQPRHAKVRPF